MKKLLFIFGTRPEAIKMVPLIKKFSSRKVFKVISCSTGQHKEMLDQVLDFFGVVPDFKLNVMKADQDLFDVTSSCLLNIRDVIRATKPDLVFVQGDTTTAFAGALAAFYEKVKVAHIEAGLRSHDRCSPFPEEINRCLISKLTDYHFVPTKIAETNLINEGIRDNIWVVGNTVIDSLFLGLNIIEESQDRAIESKFCEIDFTKKVILVTGHRRESFGKPFEQICHAIKEISQKFDVEIVYPVHLNPNVQKPVKEILSGIKNVHLLKPLDYPEFIWLMKQSHLIITDSGGVQEEAPSLGVPVLVTRTVTERTEGVRAGNALLVGQDRSKLIKSVSDLLVNQSSYIKMTKVKNPYGDGDAAGKVMNVIEKKLPDNL